MADSETTNLTLKKRAQGDSGDWGSIHNDSMDRLETRLTRNGSADPNVGETGDYIGQRYIQTGATDELPDLWICTATGSPGTWRSLFSSVRRFLKAVGGTYETLTSSGGALAIDLDLSNFFTVTLSENTTVGAPTNVPSAGTFILEVIVGGTDYTLSWNAAYKWAFGVEVPKPSGINKRHLYQIIIDSAGSPVLSALLDYS